MKKHGLKTSARRAVSAIAASKATKFPNVGKPLLDRVIIKQDPALEQTEGGIYIPETKQDDERPQRGVVIATGPGRKDEPMSVKPGDHVLFGAYAGTDVRIKGDDYLIMRESDILLTLPD